MNIEKQSGAYRGAQGRGGVTMDAEKRKKLEGIGDFSKVFENFFANF